MTRFVSECELCRSKDLEVVLDLGASPPTCAMPSAVGTGQWRDEAETLYPLALLRCKDCAMVMLSCVVDPELSFPPDYPYSSGNSGELKRDFADLAHQAQRWLVDGALVVDIGANDGTLLAAFEQAPVNVRTVAVEPTDQALRISASSVYRSFFTASLAGRIADAHGKAKVVTACNVLAHVEDVHDVIEGIAELLDPDGVLIAENHDLDSVVTGGQWDTVYHEHLRFFDPNSFARLLSRHGMKVEGWHEIGTHGGSFRMVARHGDADSPLLIERGYAWEDLRANVLDVRSALRHACASSATGVWGIGATARATTVINACGLDAHDIPYVCEVAGSDKIGRRIPGTGIPVVDEADLFRVQPEEVVLFSWHLADFIVPKLIERGYKGDIIVPLPLTRIYQIEDAA